jgi:hypothetical protein
MSGSSDKTLIETHQAATMTMAVAPLLMALCTAAPKKRSASTETWAASPVSSGVHRPLDAFSNPIHDGVEAKERAGE